MKKLILLITIILSCSTITAQEFKKVALDLGVGIHSVNDESAVNTNNLLHINAGLRYNFNPIFGLSIDADYDNLDMRSLNNGIHKATILRAGLNANVNMFKLLNLKYKRFTILANGGAGVSFLNGSNNETLFSTQIGLTGLFKINKRLAFKLDYNIMSNISQDKSLDGVYANNNYGVTSALHNASAGLVVYLGKRKNKGKESVDWYHTPDKVTQVVNNYPTQVVSKTVVVKEEAACNCNESLGNEFVFFDHDKSLIRGSELNAIFKVYTELMKNKDYKLVIKGYASPTSSSVIYNLALSQRRSIAIKGKLVDMGISSNRISIKSYGKDYDFNANNIHDVARRVELIISKQ